MPGILEISGTDIEDLQGGDGGPFRDFLVKLLQAHGRALGAPDGYVVADHRNVPDGGIDASVDRSFSNETTRYCLDRSCWQFKARSKGEVTAIGAALEVFKHHAKKLISEGYAYRLCIADNLTPEDIHSRENAIRLEIEKINPNAPTPVVLGARQIAEWASRYPALTNLVRPIAGLRSLENWKPSAVGQTSEYIPIDLWQPIRALLLAHVNFSITPMTAVLRVRGEAGVGKTRLVYETLASIQGMESLCLYTDDESVGYRFATELAATADLQAVIVIDECRIAIQERLRGLLRGVEGRIRIIAIDNTTRRPLVADPEPVIEKMSDADVERILKSNFPELSRQSILAAISLAGGYIKIAADFCQHGPVGGLQRIEDYFNFRFPDSEDRLTIEALSLLERIGWRDDVFNEIKLLAEVVGRNYQDLIDRALRIKDETGFVAIGGRYFYVTPHAFAQIAFRGAWLRWVDPDVTGFLGRLRPELLLGMTNRVRDFGTPEIRTSFSRYFDAELAIEASQLSDKKKVERLIVLIEADPDSQLQRLAALVRRATKEELARIDGGGRRKLVWMSERLAIFSEYFFAIEEILFKLALVETEPGIANNATGVWKQLHQPFLSGSSISGFDRLQLLQNRITAGTADEAELAFEGLSRSFENYFIRSETPALVSGRMVPEEWRPQTGREQRDYFERVLSILDEATHRSEPAIAEHADNLVLQKVRVILEYGFLDWIVQYVQRRLELRRRLPELLQSIDEFLEFAQTKEWKPYAEKVETWRTELLPADFATRLRVLVSSPSWFSTDSDDEEKRVRQIRELADEASQNLILLEDALPWLNSAEAARAFDFGSALGNLDSNHGMLSLLERHASFDAPDLLRGYSLGQCNTFPENRSAINDLVDRLEESDPKLAFFLIVTVPKFVDGVQRILALFDTGRINARMVAAVNSFSRPGGLELAELLSILRRLASSADTTAPYAALSVLFTWVQQQIADGKRDITDNSDLIAVARQILAKDPSEETMEVFYWANLLKWMKNFDHQFAITRAVRNIEGSYYRSREARKMLSEMADASPNEIMAELGELLLKADQWAILRMSGLTDLIARLRTESVISWVNQRGIEAARAISRSLPHPFLSDKDQPVLPSITEAVLDRFSDDDQVKQGFITGGGMRSYFSDPSVYQRKLKLASSLLSHRLAAVREWAQIEKASVEQLIQLERQEFEERPR